MTNADKIRHMDSGELAEFLCDVEAHYLSYIHKDYNGALMDWEMWLESEVRE